jgi:hypothetical protein
VILVIMYVEGRAVILVIKYVEGRAVILVIMYVEGRAVILVIMYAQHSDLMSYSLTVILAIMSVLTFISAVVLFLLHKQN